MKNIFPEFPVIDLELALQNVELVKKIGQNYNQILAKAKKNNRKNTKKLASPNLEETFKISLKYKVAENSTYRNIKKQLKKMSGFAPTNYILQGSVLPEIEIKLKNSKYNIICQNCPK
jgi:hypothetical protein